MRLSQKILVVLLFLATPLRAATYYVDKNHASASNSNACTSESLPCLTIAGGIGKQSGGGNTVFVKTGTYAESITSFVSGSAGSVNTLAVFSGATVTIQPTGGAGTRGMLISNRDYITIDGFIIDGSLVTGASGDGIRIDSSGNSLATASDHITVQNIEIKNWDNMGVTLAKFVNNNVFTATTGTCKIHDNGDSLPTANQDHGIYIRGTDNIIEKCEIYNIAFGAAIQLYDDTATNGSITNNIIRGNDMHDNRLCMTINYTSNTLVYNNKCSRSTATGGFNLQFGGPNNDKIFNNTFDTSSPWVGGSFGAIFIASAASSTQVKNNIIYGGAAGQQINNSSASSIFATNWCGFTGTGCTSTMIGNPQFVNVATRDFHLQSTSPAIGTGTTLTQFNVDYDGTSRPQGTGWDPGAFEYFPPPAAMNLTLPNGGENWQVGATKTFTWSSAGAGSTVDLLLDRNNDGTFEETVVSGTANDGSFDWVVTGPNSTTIKARVTDGTTSDVSDAVFEISGSASGSVTVTSPTSGQHLFPGQAVPITFSTVNVTGNMQILLSRNGTAGPFEILSSAFPFDGSSFTWDIVEGAANSNCLIRVTSINDPGATDDSDTFRLAGTKVGAKQ